MDVFEEDAIIAKIPPERHEELIDIVYSYDFISEYEALNEDEREFVGMVMEWREESEMSDWCDE